MSIDEIVHTCSNENVAHAAVASIGISFIARVRLRADMYGIGVGAFAARAVRSFAEEAPVNERREIMRAMFRADQPILRGLQAILERELDDSSVLDSGAWRPVTPTFTVSDGVARGCCHL